MRLDGHDAHAIEQAAGRLAAGELVAFPTETVYGLGARADDDEAVSRIYQVKGRPTGHPLIVHVADTAAAGVFASRIPALAQRLMAAHWPGPLTVIVPRAPGIGAGAAGGQDSIGLRCPAHPLAHLLLRAAAARGVPGVAAPSANRFGRVSPTTASHVLGEFGPDVWVLDGGPCDVGIESAIVDCTGTQPVLLRPGQVGRAQIESAAGLPLGERRHDSPRASGTLQAHYAPRAKVRLMSAALLAQALAVLDEVPLPLAVYSRTVRPAARARLVHRAMPALPASAAQELFSVLRAFDDDGVQLIWVEDPPASSEWEGVRDRLLRAAAA